MEEQPQKWTVAFEVPPFDPAALRTPTPREGCPCPEGGLSGLPSSSTAYLFAWKLRKQLVVLIPSKRLIGTLYMSKGVKHRLAIEVIAFLFRGNPCLPLGPVPKSSSSIPGTGLT
ncbi:hypothetical protein QOT17_015120 [Balamuthia mandrillaris]